MKKIRRDKLIGVIIHTYMKISQGNSLYNFLYLKLKCHVFHFIFALFFSYKIREQESGASPAQGENRQRWEGRRGRERGWEGEYGTKKGHTCM
jgi:hypothetical protein